ncbi:Metal tolerance protein 7 [Cocos nucifera]|uniref:Metal tolerance protein 7 n=1 Tax=Cocos nucifera TaxID=13894 RepID=A0A8K0IJN3_COCNU|nr:Metal tolerance protein 7 [Cocos nucifera]
MDLRCESTDSRTELLSSTRPDWRLQVNDFQMPEGSKAKDPPSFVSRVFARTRGHQRRIAKYYRKQENLVKGFNEMETIHESGGPAGVPAEDDLKQLAKSEGIAINISNIVNLFLFASKVLASIESRSLAVIASTLDSLLDLLSGFILWFTSYAMKKPNQYSYPIGKKRMQPVRHPTFDHEKEKWMVGSMASVTIVKFFLMLYCRSFKNEIVRAYAQDHFFDVVTNSIGLITSLLAVRYFWWMDPAGAILIALYTISTWAKTVLKNVRLLIGKTAPPEYLTRLTYLIWNHHEEIKHIDTVKAYTFGSQYFVEVDIVLSGNMPLKEAHDIGETLQEKLERLPEVERAFVHIDFEFSHRPEHNT